jgi:hypothetical protein
MKITRENIEEVAELLEDVESFRPTIKLIIDAVKSYGPELAELPERFCVWVVKRRIQNIKMYEEAGFSKKDAITMTLDDVFAVRRIFRDMAINKK